MASTVQTTPVYCLGCGCDITNRTTDRRSLQSAASEHVVQVWKAFLENVLNEEECDADVDADTLISGAGDPSRSGRMCRKCFYAYDKFQNLQTVLHCNLKKVIEVITPAAIGTKRPRLDITTPSRRPKHLSSVRLQSVASSSQPATTSPDVAVHVGYRKPRTYVLTPHRKHLGKAVARSSKKAVAVECMKDSSTRKHILKLVGKEIYNEIRLMASDEVDSFLRSMSKEDLKTFSWDRLHAELSRYAPVLQGILLAATKTRVPRPNTRMVIGMCAAILLKHRNPKMSLVQKVVSLVLYAGHTYKQVYQRLQKLNLTMSHPSLIRLVDKVGEDYDAKVKGWRDAIVTNLASSQTEPGIQGLRLNLPNEDDQLSSSSDESYNSDSDISWKDFSPNTSEDEYSESDPEPSDGTSDSDTQESDCHSSIPHDTTHQPPDTTSTPPDEHLTMYRLCGDNIDKTVKQRYMRSDTTGTESIHHFHSYAVSDRIDFCGMSETIPATGVTDPHQLALSLLPSPEDDVALRNNISILISRVLVNNLDFFKLSFDRVVDWHIKHDFYQEMSTKSDVVPLGIQPKNENKGEEMVQILSHMHKYVPVIERSEDYHIASIDETVQVLKASVHPILLGGDQLTAARARGAKKAKVNADSPTSRLDGLVPVAEDWHTKVLLLKVIWKYFYSVQSAGEHGTLYQLRNKLNRSNVVKDPKNDFNACDDFFDVVISGHIIAAAVVTLKMKSTSDSPSDDAFPDVQSLWMCSEDERRLSLDKVCKELFDTFVGFNFHEPAIKSTKDTDRVYSYSKQLLHLGCFYLEFADAIREGDGVRVLRCWRYLLPICLGSGRTNYSCEVLNMLFQHSFALPPRLSAQLLWSRFINVHGEPGKNIPADLHMEHLNRLAKKAIRGQGANITNQAVSRVGKAVGTLAPVLEQFDRENCVATPSGKHSRANAEKDISLVANELIKSEAFVIKAGRKHNSFPHPKNVLHSKGNDELLTWMVGRLGNAHL